MSTSRKNGDRQCEQHTQEHRPPLILKSNTTPRVCYYYSLRRREGGIHWRGPRAATPAADSQCLSYCQCPGVPPPQTTTTVGLASRPTYQSAASSAVLHSCTYLSREAKKRGHGASMVVLLFSLPLNIPSHLSIVVVSVGKTHDD